MKYNISNFSFINCVFVIVLENLCPSKETFGGVMDLLITLIVVMFTLIYIHIQRFSAVSDKKFHGFSF